MRALRNHQTDSLAKSTPAVGHMCQPTNVSFLPIFNLALELSQASFQGSRGTLDRLQRFEQFFIAGRPAHANSSLQQLRISMDRR